MRKGSQRKGIEIHSDVKPSNIIYDTATAILYIDEAADLSLDELLKTIGPAGELRGVWVSHHGRIHIDSVAARTENLDPPKIAEFLLIAFATTRYAAHAVGDRNEVFARECKELGRDRAVRRYWADTLRSLRPLLTRAIERALKWGAAFRRLF
jgi:hypothetical protein